MSPGLSVLVVEDHAELAEWMCAELTHAGWRTTWARTAAEAHGAVIGGRFDAVLLDIGLPDRDGIDLCRSLRALTTASILMVTARQDVGDRVRALDGGADDYLAKPFALEELLARIRAAVRRSRHEPGPVLEVGNVRLWPEERRVEVSGRAVAISRREFNVLQVLMEHPGRVLGRDQLLEAAWGYDFEGESNVVAVTLGRLRERLQGASLEITALRGVGYRLEVRS